MRLRSLRWLAVPVLVLIVGGIAVRMLSQPGPFIESFTADHAEVDYEAVEAGLEAVNMSWRAVNLDGGHFMRMEAWVDGRWILIGEHFAPEQTDRIVISHPLSFDLPRYRLTILNAGGAVMAERQLVLHYSSTQSQPIIEQFIAPVRGGIPADAWSRGEVEVPVLWRIAHRTFHQQPVIEQVLMPSGDVIGAPLHDVQRWLPREGERTIPLAPTAADAVFLRLRVVDTGTGQSLADSLITLPVVAEAGAQGAPVPAQPLLDPATTQHVRAIVVRGHSLGNDPGQLLRVGDSNIADDAAVCNFGIGNYELGPYSELQEVIDRFAASFCDQSPAAAASMSAASLLDPMWAADEQCRPNETPLACGIRLLRPTVALIYIGVQDVDRLSWTAAEPPETYRDHLNCIVTVLADEGVVPIVSTFPTGYTFHNDGSAERLNQMIVEVAAEQHIPLIDLRAETALYPNRGVDVDGFHMSTPPGGTTRFTGNEAVYARTLYELRVLQVLEQLVNATPAELQ